jgi:hypothetical protein
MRYILFFIVDAIFFMDVVLSKIYKDQVNYIFWIVVVLLFVWAELIEIRKNTEK